MKIIGPIKVYSDFGKILIGEYKNLTEVVLHFGWNQFQEKYFYPFTYTSKISPYYDKFNRMWESDARIKNKGIYIAKESNGLIIPKEIIKETWIQLSYKECIKYSKTNNFWWYHRQNNYKKSRFCHNFHNRILPKNKIKQNRIKSKNIKGGGGYFRAIHTFPESRDSIAHEQENIKVRSKRNYKNLPNSHDDYFRDSSRNRNWKKFRKTQYRVLGSGGKTFL